MQQYSTLVGIGAQMSNLCFNLSQEANADGQSLRPDIRELMADLRKRWDDEITRLRARALQQNEVELYVIENANQNGMYLLRTQGGEPVFVPLDQAATFRSAQAVKNQLPRIRSEFSG